MREEISVGLWWVWISAPIVEHVGERPRWYSYVVLPQ